MTLFDLLAKQAAQGAEMPAMTALERELAKPLPPGGIGAAQPLPERIQERNRLFTARDWAGCGESPNADWLRDEWLRLASYPASGEAV